MSRGMPIIEKLLESNIKYISGHNGYMKMCYGINMSLQYLEHMGKQLPHHLLLGY